MILALSGPQIYGAVLAVICLAWLPCAYGIVLGVWCWRKGKFVVWPSLLPRTPNHGAIKAILLVAGAFDRLTLMAPSMACS